MIAIPPETGNEWAGDHKLMVDTLKFRYGMKDGPVLEAMASVRRHVILRKEGGKTVLQNDLAVRFVPMVHGGK